MFWIVWYAPCELKVETTGKLCCSPRKQPSNQTIPIDFEPTPCVSRIWHRMYMYFSKGLSFFASTLIWLWPATYSYTVPWPSNLYVGAMCAHCRGLPVAFDIASALAYLHSINIVHLVLNKRENAYLERLSCIFKTLNVFISQTMQEKPFVCWSYKYVSFYCLRYLHLCMWSACIHLLGTTWWHAP